MRTKDYFRPRLRLMGDGIDRDITSKRRKTRDRFTDAELAFIVRQACRHNEVEITASKVVGCFTCCHISAGFSVKTFLGDGANRTACCPIKECGAPTLVGTRMLIGEVPLARMLDRKFLLALAALAQADRIEEGGLH